MSHQARHMKFSLSFVQDKPLSYTVRALTGRVGAVVLFWAVVLSQQRFKPFKDRSPVLGTHYLKFEWYVLKMGLWLYWVYGCNVTSNILFSGVFRQYIS